MVQSKGDEKMTNKKKQLGMKREKTAVGCTVRILITNLMFLVHSIVKTNKMSSMTVTYFNFIIRRC